MISSLGVSADGLGNVYLLGDTNGNLAAPNAGSYDAFVSKYNSVGSRLWTQQIGSAGTDHSTGVSADGLGNIYMSGYTNGNLGAVSAGGYDAFLAKFADPVPEPPTLALVACCMLAIAVANKRTISRIIATYTPRATRA